MSVQLPSCKKFIGQQGASIALVHSASVSSEGLSARRKAYGRSFAAGK